jgi:hypothetical protein
MGGVCSTHGKRVNAYESIIALTNMHLGVVLIDCLHYSTKQFLCHHFLMR